MPGFRVHSFVHVGRRSPISANNLVAADASAACGEEDEVLRQDRCALGLARHLAEVLPCTDNPTLEILARRHANRQRQIIVVYVSVAWDIPGLGHLSLLEGNRGSSDVTGGHRMR